jgi:hypothetical protein
VECFPPQFLPLVFCVFGFRSGSAFDLLFEGLQTSFLLGLGGAIRVLFIFNIFCMTSVQLARLVYQHFEGFITGGCIT